MPPSRVGTDGECRISLAKDYSFEDAYFESDIVARVKVGNWLGDTGGCEDISDLTYFEVTNVKCFKGNVSDTFVLIQDGSSKVTVRGYPLFTYGDELLIFAKISEAPDNPDIPYWGNSYWIIGSYTTFLDVAYDEDGNAFYICRYDGSFGKTVGVDRYNEDYKLALSLREELTSRDYIFTDKTLYHIFLATDVEQLLTNFSE